MANEKQINANRKNALKSTGPRSAVGKLISSRNSIRHGFYASNVLLPDEDRQEFVRMCRRLVLIYAPSSVLEEEQVRMIAETRWQLRRANLVDTELFQIYRYYEGEQRSVGTAFAQDASQGNAFSKLVRYQNFLLRKLQSAEKELERLRSVSPAIETQQNSEARTSPELRPNFGDSDNCNSGADQSSLPAGIAKSQK
jgi:hypothetical protein